MITKEERENRKMIDKKFGSRTELAAVLASVYPQSAEREMKRYLRRYTRGLEKIIKEADDLVASGKPKKAVLRRAKKKIEQLSLKYNPNREIGKISQQIEDTEEAQFRRSFKKTVGIDMPQFEKDMFKKEKDDWMIGTLGLIGLFLLGVNKKIDKAIDAPKDQYKAEIQKVLKESREIGSIARNRCGDLMAGINNKIYDTFGIKRYVWRTRRDSIVRECHKSFDGHIFKVTEPPEIWYMTKHGRVYTGRFCHPGEDYNCRCRAIPLFTKEAVWTILTREKWKETV